MINNKKEATRKAETLLTAIAHTETSAMYIFSTTGIVNSRLLAEIHSVIEDCTDTMSRATSKPITDKTMYLTARLQRNELHEMKNFIELAAKTETRK